MALGLVSVDSRGGVFSTALVGAGILLSSLACSQSGSAEGVDPNAPLALTMGQTKVTIENRAGVPLTDVTLTVVPYGKGSFAKTLSRLDRDERRDVTLTDLSASDGTKFNAMFTRPKLVRVVASDASGKQHTLEAPWR